MSSFTFSCRYTFACRTSSWAFITQRLQTVLVTWTLTLCFKCQRVSDISLFIYAQRNFSNQQGKGHRSKYYQSLRVQTYVSQGDGKEEGEKEKEEREGGILSLSLKITLLFETHCKKIQVWAEAYVVMLEKDVAHKIPHSILHSRSFSSLKLWPELHKSPVSPRTTWAQVLWKYHVRNQNPNTWWHADVKCDKAQSRNVYWSLFIA